MEKKKVCIVGFAPSWKDAPWGNEEYEFWCLNEFYKLIPEIKNFHADRWFEIHDINSPSKATEEHHNFLKQCPCPLYMWKQYSEFPNSVKFPLDEMTAFFQEKGYLGNRYFTNSISLMLALAIYEGYKDVSIYGVNMSNDSEYGWQKPSAEYWVGIAEGLGIKVFIPQASELLKCSQIYGFESNNTLNAWIKEQKNEIKKRKHNFSMQAKQAESNMYNSLLAEAECRGAESAYAEVLKRRQ